jgi:hypothetical protein
MDRWPERYLKTVLDWIERQWNKPSRTDYYLMRVAQRVQQQWSKKCVTIEDQKLQIKITKVRELTKEEKIARSKAIWIGGIAGGTLDGD